MNQRGTETNTIRQVRCVIYCRKSSEEGLEQDFNSLDAQREACEAYIHSQRHEGWMLLPEHYDDGGYSGGNMERPALKRLLADIEQGRVDCICIYKLDRLTRSLLDFARMIELFERYQVTFTSISQQFATTTSMGRLTLNMLLSFAQFEREITGERIRDKVAAAKRKGKYLGGIPILGYDVDRDKKKLVVNPDEAGQVRHIFQRFIEIGSATEVMRELNAKGSRTKSWVTKNGNEVGGERWNKAHIYRLLNNPLYIGRVTHKDETFPGEHEAIISNETWERVQSILATNHRARANQTRNQTPAMLKGLLRCGCCDSAMGPTFTKRRGKTYRYYKCVKAVKNGAGTCPVGSVSAGTIDDAVLEQLRGILKSPEVIAETWRQTESRHERLLAEWTEERGRLEKQIADLRDQGNMLLRARGNNGMSQSLERDLQNTNAALLRDEERLGKLVRDIAALQNLRIPEREATRLLNRLDPVWDYLFPMEKARLAELLVDKVIVRPDQVEVFLRPGSLHALAEELQ
jgi:site-specific DNA recombinase